MTAYWFFPGDLSIIVCLFYPAFYDPFFINCSISTHSITNHRGNPAKFMVINIFSFLFNLLQTFGGKVWHYMAIYCIEFFEFFIFQGGPGIPIHTTAAFTLNQVAHEVLLHHLVTY